MATAAERVVIRGARIALTALMFATTAGAQDVIGNWQGTLGSRQQRLLLKIAQSDAGQFSAFLMLLDAGGFDDPVRASDVVLRDSTVTVTFLSMEAKYEGRLSHDGSMLRGAWTQGRSTPLEFRRPTEQTRWRDPSPHTERFVAVDRDVSLEVLDWGGSGRPLVLLSGLGNTAHVFDQFAPKLATQYRVYGITRRGFGVSSEPKDGYEADRLAGDVLAVLDSLRLDRPVLIGHSIAGQELSSIGSRFPDRVGGLVYLDAAYGHAYYDSTRGHIGVDLAHVSRTLVDLATARVTSQSADGIQEIRKGVRQLIDVDLPRLEANLRAYERTLAAAQAPATAPRQPSFQAATQAVWKGVRKYTSIPVPVLAIYALPRQFPANEVVDSAARVAAEAADSTYRAAQAGAFQKGVPTARLVLLRHASHFVFRSNEQDVLREIRAFVQSLR